MFHRWTSESACIHIASPGVATIDTHYSLPEICCESQHLSTSMHLCLNYSSQTASTPGTSSHSSQAHMVLLVYLFAYLFPSLLLEKESFYKDKNGLNLPSVCSSLPSAEIPGCVSNQVFASLSIIYLVRLSLIPCLKNVKTFLQQGFPTHLFAYFETCCVELYHHLKYIFTHIRVL